MKLSDLHSSSIRYLNEDMGQQEALAYLGMMAAKQIKSPEAFVRDVQARLGGESGQTARMKMAFEKWVKEAMPTDSRVGKAFGRKVKVTVLEHKLMSEGLFDGLGDYFKKQLNKILKLDDRQEDQKVTQAIADHPELGAVLRYAQKADKPLEDDDRFWSLIDRITDGNGDKVRSTALRTYRSFSENVNPDDVKVIYEASMTDIMTSIGLSPEQADLLLKRHGIEDRDHDMGKMQQGLMSGKPDMTYGDEEEQEVEKPQKEEVSVDRNIDFAEFVVLIAAVILDDAEESEPVNSPVSDEPLDLPASAELQGV